MRSRVERGRAARPQRQRAARCRPARRDRTRVWWRGCSAGAWRWPSLQVRARCEEVERRSRG
eukprot:6393885-Prymnesium_polylepis.1